MFRRLRGLLGSFVALGFVATSGLSQDVVGSRLFGTVTDPTGNAIAKATVQIYSSETGYRRSVETGPDGTYVAPQIPAGTYQIEASVPGFKTTVLRGVTVAVNENARGDIQLQIGDVTTKVEVSSQASLVNTYTSALAQTINTRQVVDLPLNARDVTSLSMLVAG